MNSLASRHSRKRAMWDVALWLAGLLYLGLVLFGNLSIPLFGVALVALAGYTVWDRRRRKSGS